MANIWLLRHGETDWNREERLQGVLDIPLNATGVAQAQDAARRLKRFRFDRVYTSPLLRARQTANIINSKPAGPMLVSDELRELDHGVWAGLKKSALHRIYPEQLGIWRSDPDRLKLDGAERLQDAYARASRFLSRLLGTAPEKDVLIVGHGVTNSLMLCAAAGAPIRNMRRFSQLNASVVRLTTRGRTITSIDGLTQERL
jgi:phosphoserine phosphatase